MQEKITVACEVHAPIEKVWSNFTDPTSIEAWNAASSDWHTPHAENDLREGGSFLYRMEARDGSEGFDFRGTYTSVVPHERIAYTMDDARMVETVFKNKGEKVEVVTTFDPETANPLDMQRAGWQSILENFKRYVEGA